MNQHSSHKKVKILKHTVVKGVGFVKPGDILTVESVDAHALLYHEKAEIYKEPAAAPVDPKAKK
jgi:hypothetical protein